MVLYFFCFGISDIRLPRNKFSGTRASPTRRDSTSQTTWGLSGFQRTYKRESGRLHLHGETCHHFALFPYLHPGNKVKSGNVTPIELSGIGLIMEIPVEPVFLAFFYNHTLVVQECSYLHSLVVSQFYALPSVALFQPFEQVVIAVDITVLKSGV